MEINTRRNFFGKIAAMAALVTGAPKLFAQQTTQQSPPAQAPPGAPRPGTHPRAHLAEMRLVAPAAATTHTMGSTISPARVPMTAIPRTITSS